MQQNTPNPQPLAATITVGEATSTTNATTTTAGDPAATTTIKMTIATQVSVVVCFLVMVASNVLSNTAFPKSPGDLSDANPTYVTPDGLTFSIWGLIYTFEALAVVYQALPHFRLHPRLLPARKWMVSAFLLNAAWLPVFQYAHWWLSFVVISGYLYSLLQTLQHLKAHYYRLVDHHAISSPDSSSSATPTPELFSWHLKLFVFTGFSLNTAWVTIATLLNLTVVARNSAIITTVVAGNITTSGYSAATGAAVVGGNPDWAVAVIGVAIAITAVRLVRGVDVPYAFVTAWALLGISRMQSTVADTKFPAAALSADVSTWALAGVGAVAGLAVMAVLAAVVMALLSRNSKNRRG